jgi:hypothetical protein
MQQQERDHSHRTFHSSIPEALADENNLAACPMNLLNLYCADLLRRQKQTLPTSTLPQHGSHGQRLDEPLRVIDFLYGNPTQLCHHPSLSSLTEEAMQIIDHNYLNYVCMNIEIDSASNTMTNSSNKNRRDTNRIDTISRMKSPAGRSLYLVSKGSKSGKKSCVGNTIALDFDTSPHYLCLLSEETSIPDPTVTNDLPSMTYCSCRSFLERNRTNLSPEMFNRDRAILLCKHLLAIKLQPVFGTALGIAPESINSQFNIPTLEYASEEDYSRAIIKRLTTSS